MPRPGRAEPAVAVLVAHGGAVEAEGVVQGDDRVFDALLGDDAGDLDRRGRDHLEVYALVGERAEHERRDPGVRAHAGADQAELGHGVVGRVALGVQLGHDGVERLAGGRQVVDRHGAGDVGMTLLADVLDDHVDVHVGVGQGREHVGGHAGRSGTPRTVTLASSVV